MRPWFDEIREVVQAHDEGGDTRIVDLHVWRIGRQSYSYAMGVVTRNPSLTADVLRKRLAVHKEIVHSTIEVYHR